MRYSAVIAGLAVAVVASAASANRVEMRAFNAPNLPGLDLYVDVTDDPSGGVTFTFGNDSTNGAIITTIYFEQTGSPSHPLSNAMLSGASTGVLYEPTTGPGPGGGIPNWLGNEFRFDRVSQSGVSNGIAAGESLSISFDSLGFTASQIASLVANPNQENGFRLSQHVQSISDGEGGDFSVFTVSIPTPSAAFMGAAGLLILTRRRRGTH